MTTKTFVLTFFKNGKAIPVVQRQTIHDLHREKKRLMFEPKYRGGVFQIRTLDGFAAKEIL